MNTDTPHSSASTSGPVALSHADYLDGWRGLAIALVLQSHFWDVLRFQSGGLGVDIFFSLSGLLMSNLLFIRRMPLGTFYKRRISRIFPAFVLFVLVIYLPAIVRGTSGALREASSTLIFLRTYFPTSPSIWSSSFPISHIWSLNVEEHSYVFLSMLTLIPLLRGREWFVLIGAGTACLLTGLVYLHFPAIRPHYALYNIGTETAAAPLLVSAGYALCSHRYSTYVRGWMPLASLGLAVICYTSLAPEFFSPFLLAFTTNHLQQAPSWFRAILESRVMRMLGIWSFSLYLWQQPFSDNANGLVGGRKTGFLLTVMVGLASYYLLEKPIRSRLNKRW